MTLAATPIVEVEAWFDDLHGPAPGTPVESQDVITPVQELGGRTKQLRAEKYDKTGGEIDGNVNVTGSIVVDGAASVGADVEIAGNVEVTGTLDVVDAATLASDVEIGGKLVMTGADPAKEDDPGANTLHAALIPKAWALVRVNAGVYTVLDGINVAAGPGALGTQVEITFAQPMANAFYSATITVGGAAGGGNYASILDGFRTVNGFRFNVFSSAGVVDLTAAGQRDINVMVMGRQ